jgi:hypothetical protein
MFNGDDLFNVDDLIKKIDAKIAELEAEEKNQTDQKEPVVELPNSVDEKHNPTPFIPIPTPISDVIEDHEPIAKKEENVTEAQYKPVESDESNDDEIVNINPDIDKIINSYPDDDNTDDQFFDDFFNDDDE